MVKTDTEKYKEIIRKNNGILRYSRARQLGVPRYIIEKLVSTGELLKELRGLYRLTDAEPLSNPDLVQVSLLIPRGVICLISALYFHDLTTQIPRQVYIALRQSTTTPTIEYPPIRAFHFSEQSFAAGVQNHIIDGINVKIYGKEKTVADCFKFRKQIGVNIAVEALKDYMQQPGPDTRSLMQYARINRVQNVMRPYVETLS